MLKDTPTNIFPSNNILTVSAEDYFMISRKNPADYTAVGVHVIKGGAFDSCGRYASKAPSPLEVFSAEVPKGTEVVVGYRTSISCNQRDGYGDPVTVAYTASGTALISKKALIPEHCE